MKYILSIFAIAITCSNPGLSQDSLFTLENAWHLNRWSRVLSLSKYQFENRDKLYFAASTLIEQGGFEFEAGIVDNGEIIQRSERYQTRIAIGTTLAADFNEDSVDDILIWMHGRDEILIFDGSDCSLLYEDETGYSDGYMSLVGFIPDQNNRHIPLLLQQCLIDSIGIDDDLYFLWAEAILMRGSPIHGGLDSITVVPNYGSLATYSTPQRQDYFVVGYSSHSWSWGGIGEFDSTYIELTTSFNSEWNDPDTFVVARSHDFVGELQFRKTFDISKNSVVGDFNNDGDLEWIFSYWDETDPDSYVVHIRSYDPSNFDLVDEYAVTLPGLGHLPYSTRFCKGVRAVDINEDGVWELLLAVRGNPLQVIDSRDMSLIMVSDIELPDIADTFFEIGYFEEGVDNLQLVVMSARGIEVFNLPEDWRPYPTSVGNSSEKSLRSFMLNPAYPNPFNSTTCITYELDRSMNIQLAVYNNYGQQLETIYQGNKTSGLYEEFWNAEGIPSGLYLIRLNTSTSSYISKVVLIR